MRERETTMRGDGRLEQRNYQKEFFFQRRRRRRKKKGKKLFGLGAYPRRGLFTN
jgi:hypothetical protein